MKLKSLKMYFNKNFDVYINRETKTTDFTGILFQQGLNDVNPLLLGIYFWEITDETELD